MTDLALLSLDVEEFDLPLERGTPIPDEAQFETSRAGMARVEALLADLAIPATLFTTARFALRYPDLMRSLASRHEIASHAFSHSAFEHGDLLRSRETLEAVCGVPVTGFRRPRMQHTPAADLRAAGYRYNSSINPTWVPGRYNHLRAPRTPTIEDGIVQIPASVTPTLRIPLFWLAFKNLPPALMRSAASAVLRRDAAVNLYFHPWEFADLKPFGLPRHIAGLDGERLLDRLASFLRWLKPRAEFATFSALEARARQGG